MQNSFGKITFYKFQFLQEKKYGLMRRWYREFWSSRFGTKEVITSFSRKRTVSLKFSPELRGFPYK